MRFTELMLEEVAKQVQDWPEARAATEEVPQEQG
jgi:hypothetical protein